MITNQFITWLLINYSSNQLWTLHIIFDQIFTWLLINSPRDHMSILHVITDQFFTWIQINSSHDYRSILHMVTDQFFTYLIYWKILHIITDQFLTCQMINCHFIRINFPSSLGAAAGNSSSQLSENENVNLQIRKKIKNSRCFPTKYIFFSCFKVLGASEVTANLFCNWV